jgi:putative ABC transport system permease protein
MLTHLFKLIWNKKKQNALLITEMFISFIVMFAVFTLVVFSYRNYKQPMGFDYEDVWAINFTPPENIKGYDSAVIFHDALKKEMMAMGPIKEISFCGFNFPFSMSTSNGMVSYGNQKSKMTNIYSTEETYKALLDMHMLEGRWFTKEDDASKYTPAVMTKKMKEELFGNESPIGKVLGDFDPTKGVSQNRFKITGVVDDIKDKGSYQAVENGLYTKMDSSAIRWAGNMLVKVQPGTGAAFESKLFKTLSNAIGTSIEIEHLDKKLVSKNKVMLVPMIIGFIVAGFLIINVALGLFGVLWYNINKRRGEIGLRRAVGATGNSVSKQLVGEALVLSTISLIIGCFFAFQFPLLNVFDLPAGIYLIAIVLAVAFIYALVTVCALYPGKQAAAIYPAVALHED